ncbi:hypothetical protein PV08_05808 [Exophiala spinifera]|uniref:Helicase ATP-binding domain-containing protein n=1 Tax=Exophiala spinifera TaxID=91928 RepID=A0A0D2B9T7_9EURO|nr:uncharacterized protein PV08_05808 [Exophiala spinifera]KIW15758.1 hypothetical protein PV08_05808 [Exophiala spinifera]
MAKGKERARGRDNNDVTHDNTFQNSDNSVAVVSGGALDARLNTKPLVSSTNVGSRRKPQLRPRPVRRVQHATDLVPATARVAVNDLPLPQHCEVVGTLVSLSRDDNNFQELNAALGAVFDPDKIQKTTFVEPVTNTNSKNRHFFRRGKSLYSGLDPTKPPLHDIDQIFLDMAEKALTRHFDEACRTFEEQALKIFTLCSGTDSPVVATSLISRALRQLCVNNFNVNHVGSCEIEPVKQAFLERNFHPSVLFRDVTEFINHATHPNDDRYLPRTAYGAPARPPKHVNLLVAGASCVDFSSLNSNRPVFDPTGQQGGESSTTFAGIFAYMETYRPNLVILENVESAKWEKISDRFKEIRYHCQVVKLDTINFYLPQTRNRTYCFVIDEDHADRVNLKVAQVSKDWVQLFAYFQKRATSPYPSFLLDDSDPRLILEKAKNFSVPSVGRTQEWDSGRRIHFVTRTQLHLGSDTPYTQMRDHPPCNMDNYASQTWAMGQSERVLDLLDIHYLNNAISAKRGTKTTNFDMRYKHRNVNYSQNVDRDLNSRKWGIVGCITPKGSLYDTVLGRPLVGSETFSLTGLPIGDLSLNKETSALLQDLSGNAMSTTVVGAAILSAILAIQKQQVGFFDSYVKAARSSSELKPSSEMMLLPSRQTAQESDIFNHETQQAGTLTLPSLEYLVDAMNRSTPYCHCETSGQHAAAGLIFCPQCFYTSCTTCCRRPHGGMENLIIDSRRPSDDFARELTLMLPAVLDMKLACSINDLPPFSWGEQSSRNEKFSDQLRYLLFTTLNETVRFREVKFDRTWRVIYDSKFAKLELEFIPGPFRSKDGKDSSTPLPIWRLFAKPRDTEPVNSKLRSLFQHQIAEMSVDTNLLSGSWAFWNGVSKQKVKIQAHGSTVPSWRSQLGLEHESGIDDRVFTRLEVKAPDNYTHGRGDVLNSSFGKYVLLPNCPAACQTLHKKVSANDSNASTFMYLKPDPLQDSHLDSVVISTQPAHRNMQDERSTLTKFRRGWIFPHGPNEHLSPSEQEVECEVFNNWTLLPELSMCPAAEENEFKLSRPRVLPPPEYTRKSCDDAGLTIFSLAISLDAAYKDQWTLEEPIFIEIEDKPEALKDFVAFLAHATKLLDPPAEWKTVSVAAGWSCRTCLPKLPDLEWVVKDNVLTAFENPRQAKEFEHALEIRPKAATAIVVRSTDTAHLTVKINLKTLAHRASSLLYEPGRLELLSTAQWRIVPYNRFALHPTFGPFDLSSNDSDVPISYGVVGNRTLWHSQRQILSWMQNQEEKPEKWKELSQIECRVPSLGLNTEVKAFSEKIIRGGIIADCVGGGKTTTSLAHIYHGYISGRLTKDSTSHDSSGLIDSDATLVLMPKNILAQWVKELNECIPSWTVLTRTKNDKTVKPCDTKPIGPYYIVVTKTSEILDYSIEDFKNAALILAPFNILEDDQYYKNLQDQACAPHVPNVPGRAFKQWMDQAMHGLRSVCGFLPSDTAQAWNNWEKLRSEIPNYDRFPETLTRKTKKAQKSGKSKTAASNDESGETSEATFRKDFEEKLQAFQDKDKFEPLFHLFHFSRVIVDEFTYVAGKCLLALLKINAQAKWLLSGTPPIHDYDGVNTMAKLLGTRVSTFNEQDGKFGFGKDRAKMVKDKSDAQRFRYLQNVLSAGYKKSMYEHAESFLKIFVRKNKPSIEGIKVMSHEHYFTLSASETVALDMMNDAIAKGQCDFTRKSPNSKQLEGGLRGQIQAAAQSCGSPEAARLCLSSFLHTILDLKEQGAQQYEEKGLSLLKHQLEAQCLTLADNLLEHLRGLWHADGCQTATKVFDDLIDDINNAGTEETDVVPLLRQMSQYAEANPKPPVPNWDTLKAIQKGKAVDNRTTRVRELIPSLSEGMGKLRFMNLVSSVVRSEALQACNACSKPVVDYDKVHISVKCGHIVACSGCASASSHPLGCCNLFRPGGIKPACRFVVRQLDPSVQHVADVVRGTMAQAAISLIKGRIPPGESVVVFMQFAWTRVLFVEGCRRTGIAAYDAWGGDTSSIEDFKEAAGTGQAVLALKVDSEDSAGHNLQVANHVVFLGPVMGMTGAERAATMEQAVGRCRRHGQRKLVHVWHLAPESV